MIFLMILVSRSTIFVVAIQSVSIVQGAMKTDLMTAVLPSIVHIERVIGSTVMRMVAIPRLESSCCVKVIVVVAKIIVAITGTHPEMRKGSSTIHD